MKDRSQTIMLVSLGLLFVALLTFSPFESFSISSRSIRFLIFGAIIWWVVSKGGGCGSKSCGRKEEI